jgi:hypothetical protein
MLAAERLRLADLRTRLGRIPTAELGDLFEY